MAGNCNKCLAAIGYKARYWPLATATIYVFAVSAAGRISHGAPIVFKFDATVSAVEGDVMGLNLPFSLVIGQQITGKFTFQSHEDLLDIFLHHERGKEGRVSLTIDGAEIVALTNLGTFNDGGPVDINGPPPGPNSSLSLGYVSPTDVFPGWGSHVAGHPSGIGLVLVGPVGTISEHEDLVNVNVWNQMTTLRGLGLQIGWPDTVVIQATVGDFVPIPEPPTILLVWAMILTAMTYRLVK